MSRWATSTCRSCFEPVIWASTIQGSRMCFNVEPIPIEKRSRVRSLFVFVDRGHDRPLAQLASMTDPEVAASNEQFQPHNETCPHSDSWRGTR